MSEICMWMLEQRLMSRKKLYFGRRGNELNIGTSPVHVSYIGESLEPGTVLELAEISFILLRFFTL